VPPACLDGLYCTGSHAVRSLRVPGCQRGVGRVGVGCGGVCGNIEGAGSGSLAHSSGRYRGWGRGRVRDRSGGRGEGQLEGEGQSKDLYPRDCATSTQLQPSCSSEVNFVMLVIVRNSFISVSI
jgi:hypothetical protein